MCIAKPLTFLLAFAVGIVGSSAYAYFLIERELVRAASSESIDLSKQWGMYAETNPNTVGPGTGLASCGLTRDPLNESLPGDAVKTDADAAPYKTHRVTEPLKVTYKEKAQYTDEARSKGIEGTVTLRVTFLASGGIGSITIVRGLPFGLTEQAIEAVRKMRFEPEQSDQGPRTTVRPVSFTFNIY